MWSALAFRADKKKRKKDEIHCSDEYFVVHM